MNLSYLRNRVLNDKLDDTEFDSGITDNFVNDTLRDIYNEYELTFQERIFIGTIPSGATMFTFPTDVAEIQHQVLTAPEGVRYNLEASYVDFRDFSNIYPDPDSNTPGNPVAWTLYAGNMIFSCPLPADYKMKIFYIAKPDKLVEDTDVPQFPEEFEEVIVLGAFARIQDRNEDYDESAVTYQQYNNKLDLLVSRYGFRKTGPVKMKNQQVATRRR